MLNNIGEMYIYIHEGTSHVRLYMGKYISRFCWHLTACLNTTELKVIVDRNVVYWKWYCRWKGFVDGHCEMPTKS
jgi:uncharacterized protein YfaT (DUF1175 family)